jgi:hypothetical protein
MFHLAMWVGILGPHTNLHYNTVCPNTPYRSSRIIHRPPSSLLSGSFPQRVERYSSLHLYCTLATVQRVHTDSTIQPEVAGLLPGLVFVVTTRVPVRHSSRKAACGISYLGRGNDLGNFLFNFNFPWVILQEWIPQCIFGSTNIKAGFN